MKRLLVSFAALAVLLFLASPAFAQKGRGPGGAAGGPGIGSTHANANAGTKSDTGKGKAPNAKDAGKKTPDQILANNTKLSDKLAKLLPNGMTPQQACANFKNLGQCVAAIHVAHNLGIDFNSLECDMTLKPVSGTTCPANTGTGSKGMSLGQAIDTLKPGSDAKAESKKATKQANDDIKESGSSS